MGDLQPEDVKDRAVAFMEKIKGVTDAHATEENDVAGGILVTVRLKKYDEESWGWYFEKGDVRRALFNGEDIAVFVSKQLSRKTAIETIFNNLNARDSYSVSAKFLVASILVVYLAFLFSNNGDRLFVFLVTMSVATFIISISARVYFSDFKSPDTIPEKDRELLVGIIRQGEKDQLDAYIKLSSLSGFTGNITKLGLSGLPLITVALTVFFTSLAALLWSISKAGDSNTMIANMMDLSKLTLGAFIGSFVQRNVSAVNNIINEKNK